MLGVALVLRLGVAFLLPLPADFATLSEPGWTAANLVSGNGYTFDFYGTRPDHPLQDFTPPLHPWLIALALLFPDPALAYALLQAFLGTLTVWLLLQLARAVVGRRAGALSGWGAALYPAHVLLTGQPLSAVLHACCLVAVLLAGWRLKERPTVGRALLAGGLVGLLGLGRAQILGFLPVLVGWLWLNGVRGRRLGRAVAGLVAAAVAVLLPWSVRNAVVLGWPLPTPTNDGVTFWNGNNPFTTCCGHDVYADKLAAYQGVARDPALPDVYEHPEPYPFPPEVTAQLGTLSELGLRRAFFRAGFDYIRQHPLDWLKLEWRKLVSFWWFRPNLGANPLYRAHWTDLYRIQYAALAALTLAGVVLSLRGAAADSAGGWRGFALLYGIMAYTSLVQVLFEVLTRYRWEIELLMLIFAALALDTAWQRVTERRMAR
jgi:hypothetical protein